MQSIATQPILCALIKTYFTRKAKLNNLTDVKFKINCVYCLQMCNVL